MSTRCSILVTDGKQKINIYHHTDGFIEGVGFDLLKRFWLTKNKFFNIDDTFVLVDEIANILVKDSLEDYEITSYEHADIDYSYVIDVKKRELRATEVSADYDKHTDTYSWKIKKQWSFKEILDAFIKEKGKIKKETDVMYEKAQLIKQNIV